MNTETRAIILAGGRGSRFCDGAFIPKVLRRACDVPLIDYVINTLHTAGVDDICIVVGFMGDEVVKSCGKRASYAFQTEQKGSGDAVACVKKDFDNFCGNVIIMCGDSPLFTSSTVKKMISTHKQSQAYITLGTTVLKNPYGYGRIKRDKNRKICGIIEEKCADEKEREISEVGGGIYIFDSKWLFSNIDKIELNAANEYNLTDMVRVAVCQDKSIETIKIAKDEILGVNTPQELLKIEEILKRR